MSKTLTCRVIARLALKGENSLTSHLWRMGERDPFDFAQDDKGFGLRGGTRAGAYANYIGPFEELRADSWLCSGWHV